MKYQILVSNKSGIPSGEIVGVFPSDQKFSPIEVMSEHIKAGGTVDNWTRLFSLIIGTDGNYEDMKYLEGYKSDGITKRYFFNQPERTSQEFLELYHTGQVSRTTEQILAFIGER